MNQWYGFLMNFTQGATPCRKYLLRRYSEAEIDEAIRLGYITQVSVNDLNDPQYQITDCGKDARDK